MYASHVSIEHVAFEEVVDRVVEALKEQEFGVVSDLDVQEMMRGKLGAEMLPYRILGACKPDLAMRAISAEPDIGLLLPCNVVVREDAPGKITVALIDPMTMVEQTDSLPVRAVAEEASARLLEVGNRLAGVGDESGR